MGISEKKMQIVINNYFKQECDVNTSIREAFEKGFRIGVKKASSTQPERKTGRWIYEETQYKISSYRCSECERHVLHESKSDVCEAYPYCHCGAKMGE